MAIAQKVDIPIQNKATNTPGRAPTVAEIVDRQLFINLADQKIYTKYDNTIIPLGTVNADFSQVAFTGQYSDLLGLPTIPTAYTLPAATATLLGGIKAGIGLTVAPDGTTIANVQTVQGSYGPAKNGVVIITRSDLGLDILDPNNKILPQYLPDSITGGMVYKGTWDASLNIPAIPAAAAGNLGWLYVVAVAGNTPIDGNSTWARGDWLTSNGVTWERIEAVSSDVLTVNGQTGDAVIDATNLPGLAEVAKTNDYNDLLNLPVLATVANTGEYDDLQNKPDLALVATSGEYADLLGLPPDTTITDIGVSVNGTPVTNAAEFIFTRPMEFAVNFTGSQAFARLQSGTTTQVRIMKGVGATFTQVGTLTITNGVAVFTSISSGVTQFAVGDILRYEWVNNNISAITITVQAKRL